MAREKESDTKISIQREWIRHLHFSACNPCYRVLILPLIAGGRCAPYVYPPPVERDEDMSTHDQGSGRDGAFISGYIEGRIASGEERSYGYPDNGIPSLTVKTLTLESSILVALKHVDKRDTSR